jgi:hypothetical protein
MLIEYEDADERRRALSKLKGIEDRVWVQVEGSPRVFAIADEDLERENDEKTSAVHFLRFELTPEMVAALKRGAALGMGVDHPNYRAEIPAVGSATRDALVRGSRLERRALVPEVVELQREVGNRLLDERDRALQLVAFASGHADGLALDGTLDLQLAILENAHDLLRQLLLDAFADGDHLLYLVSGNLLDVAVLERADIHTALGELGEQDVGDRESLKSSSAKSVSTFCARRGSPDPLKSKRVDTSLLTDRGHC